MGWGPVVFVSTKNSKFWCLFMSKFERRKDKKEFV